MIQDLFDLINNINIFQENCIESKKDNGAHSSPDSSANFMEHFHSATNSVLDGTEAIACDPLNFLENLFPKSDSLETYKQNMISQPAILRNNSVFSNSNKNVNLAINNDGTKMELTCVPSSCMNMKPATETGVNNGADDMELTCAPASILKMKYTPETGVNNVTDDMDMTCAPASILKIKYTPETGVNNVTDDMEMTCAPASILKMKYTPATGVNNVTDDMEMTCTPSAILKIKYASETDVNNVTDDMEMTCAPSAITKVKYALETDVNNVTDDMEMTCAPSAIKKVKYASETDVNNVTDDMEMTCAPSAMPKVKYASETDVNNVTDDMEMTCAPSAIPKVKYASKTDVNNVTDDMEMTCASSAILKIKKVSETGVNNVADDTEMTCAPSTVLKIKYASETCVNNVADDMEMTCAPSAIVKMRPTAEIDVNYPAAYKELSSTVKPISFTCCAKEINCGNDTGVFNGAKKQLSSVLQLSEESVTIDAMSLLRNTYTSVKPDISSYYPKPLGKIKSILSTKNRTIDATVKSMSCDDRTGQCCIEVENEISQTSPHSKDMSVAVSKLSSAGVSGNNIAINYETEVTPCGEFSNDSLNRHEMPKMPITQHHEQFPVASSDFLKTKQSTPFNVEPSIVNASSTFNATTHIFPTIEASIPMPLATCGLNAPSTPSAAAQVILNLEESIPLPITTCGPAKRQSLEGSEGVSRKVFLMPDASGDAVAVHLNNTCEPATSHSSQPEYSVSSVSTSVAEDHMNFDANASDKASSKTGRINDASRDAISPGIVTNFKERIQENDKENEIPLLKNVKSSTTTVFEKKYPSNEIQFVSALGLKPAFPVKEELSDSFEFIHNVTVQLIGSDDSLTTPEKSGLDCSSGDETELNKTHRQLLPQSANGNNLNQPLLEKVSLCQLPSAVLSHNQSVAHGVLANSLSVESADTNINSNNILQRNVNFNRTDFELNKSLAANMSPSNIKGKDVSFCSGRSFIDSSTLCSGRNSATSARRVSMGRRSIVSMFETAEKVKEIWEFEVINSPDRADKNAAGISNNCTELSSTTIEESVAKIQMNNIGQENCNNICSSNLNEPVENQAEMEALSINNSQVSVQSIESNLAHKESAIVTERLMSGDMASRMEASASIINYNLNSDNISITKMIEVAKCQPAIQSGNKCASIKTDLSMLGNIKPSISSTNLSGQSALVTKPTAVPTRSTWVCSDCGTEEELLICTQG